MENQILKANKLIGKAKNLYLEAQHKDLNFDSKDSFAELHEELVQLGILDGSKDTLIADIADMGAIEAFDSIVTAIAALSEVKQVKMLVYLAIAGFARTLIIPWIKSKLNHHLKQIQAEFNSGKYVAVKKIVKGSNTYTDEQYRKVAISRINALKKVLSLRGDRFLKRSIYVLPTFKIKYEDVK